MSTHTPGLAAGRTSEFKLLATLIESALFHYADDLNSFQLSFHSSDKRANGLEETTSVSSPSCSSSPSLLGLSLLLPLPGRASRWDENSSASFSCCRNRLLSECLSWRRAISFVSGWFCHSAVKKIKALCDFSLPSLRRKRYLPHVQSITCFSAATVSLKFSPAPYILAACVSAIAGVTEYNWASSGLIKITIYSQRDRSAVVTRSVIESTNVNCLDVETSP